MSDGHNSTGSTAARATVKLLGCPVLPLIPVTLRQEFQSEKLMPEYIGPWSNCGRIMTRQLRLFPRCQPVHEVGPHILEGGNMFANSW